MSPSGQSTTLEFWRGRLPHWEVADAIHFVTIHVAGAIPVVAASKIRQMSDSLSRLPPSKHFSLQKRIFAEMERWLDRTGAIDYLTRYGVAEMVVEAVHYRMQAGIWRVIEYVVMPSHIHLLIEILQTSLKESIESFKEHTGRQAATILDRHGHRFWQTEWFDHWVRNPDEANTIAHYIQQNPEKARLVTDCRQWPSGSWSKMK